MPALRRTLRASLVAAITITASLLFQAVAAAEAITPIEGPIPFDTWAYINGKDPIDDTETKGAFIYSERGLSISIVCANKDFFVHVGASNPVMKAQFIGLGMKGKSAAVTWRVDSGKPIEETWEVSGRMAMPPNLVAPDKSDFAKQIFSAKTKFVLRAAGETYVLPLKQASDILSIVFTQCGIKP